MAQCHFSPKVDLSITGTFIHMRKSVCCQSLARLNCNDSVYPCLFYLHSLLQKLEDVVSTYRLIYPSSSDCADWLTTATEARSLMEVQYTQHGMLQVFELGIPFQSKWHIRRRRVGEAMASRAMYCLDSLLRLTTAVEAFSLHVEMCTSGVFPRQFASFW